MELMRCSVEALDDVADVVLDRVREAEGRRGVGVVKEMRRGRVVGGFGGFEGLWIVVLLMLVAAGEDMVGLVSVWGVLCCGLDGGGGRLGLGDI